MKKALIVLMITIIYFKAHSQVKIKPSLFSINAWFIDARGVGTNTFASNFTTQLTAVKASGCTHVRIGGIMPNWDQLYNFDGSLAITTATRLVYLVEKIRGEGMEPIIQVSCAPPQWTTTSGCPIFVSTSSVAPLGTLSISDQATVAGNLVTFFTTGQFAPPNHIQFWSIANEPDHDAVQVVSSNTICTEPRGFGLNGSGGNAVAHAAIISDYIKQFSAAMKTACSKIRIMGPELAAFGNDDNDPVNNVMEELLSPLSNGNSILGTMTNVAAPDNFFVDIITFHHYPGFGSTFSNAAGVIDQPANHNKSFKEHLLSSPTNTASKGLINMITNANANRLPGNCSLACTEFNLEMYGHEGVVTETSTTTYSQTINGFGNRSFLGGQWLSEIFAEAMKPNQNVSGLQPWVSMMNLWSTKEGDCTRGLGYISGCNSPNGSSTFANYKRPMYHHYEMMANNFKGAFFTSTLTVTGSASSDIKAWAAQGTDRVAVLIINQSSSNRTFSVKLNTLTAPPSGDLKISFDIPNTTTVGYEGNNNDPEHQEIEANSTVLLLFNCKGTASERRDYSKSMVLASPHATPVVISLGTPLAGIYGSTVTTTPFPGTTNTANVVVITNTTGMTITWPSIGPCGPISSTNSGLTATLTACNGTANVLYTFTVTDADGCWKEDVYTVNGGIVVPTGSPFLAWLDVPQSATCGLNNGTAAIWADNASQYGPSFKWDSGIWLAPNSGTNGYVHSSLAPGLHTVLVCYNTATAAGAGTILHYEVFIGETNKPPVSAGNDFYCGNYCPANLTAWPDLSGSGYTYQWYEVNGNTNTVIPAGVSCTVTQWQNSIYKVVVTSTANANCKNEDDIQVTSYLNCKKRNVGVWPTYPCGEPTARPTGGISTETLTSNLTIDSDQYFNKIIVVPEGISLTINECQLAMRDSSKIIVTTGGTLTLNKVFMYPCIDKWDGIDGSDGTAIKINVTGSVIHAGPIKIQGASNLLFEDNVFIDSHIALELTECTDFIIQRNTFQNAGYGIKTLNTPTSSAERGISANYFIDVDTCIYCNGDDHSNLSITCNIFENYGSYAVYSENTTMADQGSSVNGAGNEFNSASTNTNHQFHHHGNEMIYYYGPGLPLSLSTSPELNATSIPAESDPACPEVLKSRSAMVTPGTLLKQGTWSEWMINAYPNPFKDEFTIEYSLIPNTRSLSLLVTEAATGRIMIDMPLDVQAGKAVLNSELLANGLYICSLKTDKGSTKRFKLVKMD